MDELDLRIELIYFLQINKFFLEKKTFFSKKNQYIHLKSANYKHIFTSLDL